MSWGTKIAFLYISFAGMIAFMVYKSSMQNVDLVAPNYYEQELSYQDKIDGINNVSAQANAINMEQTKEAISFKFLKELGEPKGHILFFKPDEASSDFETEISVDALGIQKVNTTSLTKGAYIVKVDWTLGKEKYFKEERIIIN